MRSLQKTTRELPCVAVRFLASVQDGRHYIEPSPISICKPWQKAGRYRCPEPREVLSGQSARFPRPPAQKSLRPSSRPENNGVTPGLPERDGGICCERKLQP